MLNTALYDRALNLLVENGRAAIARADEAEQKHLVQQLIALLDYGKSHGLTLSTRCGQFCFVRNGYSPATLYIQTRDEREER